MATATDDVDQIRRQMAQIRRELHEDVRGVVASAEAVTDWHRHIRKHPWLALGVAAAVGYVIVPRRHRQTPTDLATHADMARVREAVEETRDAAKEKKASSGERKGLVAMGLAALGPVALRAAQGYAVQYLENWILQQQQAMAAGPPPPPGPTGAPGDPGRPGGRQGR